ncbi:MAG: hypothetical protein ABL956_10220 [Hyphomonadaceae bacterium]
MLSKLTRIVLAIATAFVFTGQMEAATAHCARLAMTHAVPERPAPAAETPPCHENGSAQVVGHTAPPQDHQHHPQPDHCECIAALKTCLAIATASASRRIEPYAWMLPSAAAFVSTEPAPDWRPPRA